MKKNVWKWMIMGSVLLMLCSCGGAGQQAGTAAPSSVPAEQEVAAGQQALYEELVWEQTENVWADQFKIEKCGEYTLITIVDSGRFLLVSGEMEIPGNLPEDVAVLRKPLQNVYLSSSSVFDLISHADAMDRIRFSGTKADSLYIPEVVKAMEEGKMIYAGKYSAPDYELLVSGECPLAIENTMIWHNPQVKEKMEMLGIPVLVERSSYESHPLGRLEWIRLYGVLFDQESQAETFFEEKRKAVEPVLEQEKTGCKVAFFYVNTNGAINVRKPGDYIAKMIALAGGEYILQETGEEENALSTMNMQMEDFYLAAKDADVIIYNGTTTGVITGMEELLEKSALFGDFKAVKENRVYCTGKNFFQETTAIGDLMEDLGHVLRGQEEAELHQLLRVQ